MTYMTFKAPTEGTVGTHSPISKERATLGAIDGVADMALYSSGNNDVGENFCTYSRRFSFRIERNAARRVHIRSFDLWWRPPEKRMPAGFLLRAFAGAF